MKLKVSGLKFAEMPSLVYSSGIVFHSDEILFGFGLGIFG